jgi:sensor c-di-GMP phosphodiesterase-like protein
VGLRCQVPALAQDAVYELSGGIRTWKVSRLSRCDEYHRPMHREAPRILILYGLAAIAVVVPIAVASWLAERESLQREQERAGTIASELLRRSEKIADQLRRVFVALDPPKSGEPCSEQSIELMRTLVIKSNLLIDIGYVRGNELVCSSFGREAVLIGPPTYRGGHGYIVRVAVQHPLAPDAQLIIVTDPKTGYTGMVSQALLLDPVPDESNLTAGMIAVQSRRVLAERGSFNPAWLNRIGSSYDITFNDGAGVVGWRRSDRTDYAAFVAIGRHRIEQDQREILLILMPIGIAAGALLLFAVVRLVRLQTSMPSLLKSALRTRKEFFLLYQPIVDLQAGRWCGVEALLRWRRPNGELISPDIFIPIAERGRLMERITDTVLDILERDAGKLLRSLPEFHVALNLSADDFCRSDIVERLTSMVQRMRIVPANLHVEATERIFLNIEASRRNLQQLRSSGIKVAIDDFGTGYSSLSYLHSLEADWLKIDKTFVDTIGTQSVTSEVIRHIIEIGKSLKMAMVAEGVETAAQADFLRTHEVQYAQGWLFAKPMPMEQVLQQLGLG